MLSQLAAAPVSLRNLIAQRFGRDRMLRFRIRGQLPFLEWLGVCPSCKTSRGSAKPGHCCRIKVSFRNATCSAQIPTSEAILWQTSFLFVACATTRSKVKPSEVMTQPYDKITPAMQDHYYAASPYNLVRIILGKPQPGDNEQRERLHPRCRLPAAVAGRRRSAARRRTQHLPVHADISRCPATPPAARPSGAASSPSAAWRITTRRSSSATSRRSASPRPTA